MAIEGPNIQAPSPSSRITEQEGQVSLEWASLFSSLQKGVYNDSRSGVTADRPTSSMQGRWIGMRYFDTTLGKPVFLKSVNPDVWVDGTGAVV